MPVQQLNFQKDLRNILLADQEVSDQTVGRIYSSRLPQNSAYPALSFIVVGIDPTQHKDGASSYDIIRVQFNHYGKEVGECERLADSTRKLLDRYSNNGLSVDFHQVFFIDREAIQFEDTSKVYWLAVDYNFHIKKK